MRHSGSLQACQDWLAVQVPASVLTARGRAPDRHQSTNESFLRTERAWIPATLNFCVRFDDSSTPQLLRQRPLSCSIVGALGRLCDRHPQLEMRRIARAAADKLQEKAIRADV